jgi:membrane protein YqaA with SNARE-associated domain
MAAHGGHIPHWLLHLGLPGLCLISFLDASPIPLPIPGSADLLLLLLCARHGSNPFLLAGLTIVSSVVGGYLTWRAGKSGGEAMLHHFAPKRMVELVTRWMKSHGGLTIAASAVLPPPVPLLPLLLGAGALGATRNQFLLAFSLARAARYGFVAWIGTVYGPRVLHWWNHYLSKWSMPVLVGFLVLIVAGMIFGFWQYRRQRSGWRAKQAEGAK